VVVVRVGSGVGAGGDGVVRIGTSVGTGVTAAGVIGRGVEPPIGVMAAFSGDPFFFWTRYHPVAPTINKATIAIATRIDLRPDGRIGGCGIDGFSG
jgi:hypothetical protein